MTTALAFYSMPTHWLGLMLVILFAGVLPTGGMSNDFLIDPSFATHVKDLGEHILLPSLTLALVLYGEYTLIVRSALLETLGEDYILTARAKGLKSGAILRKHALRNAMLPIVTLIALSLGYIVAGAILVETVFSWPGIGRAVYDAVAAARLPDAAGSVPDPHGLRGLLQSRRRPPLLQARSEGDGMSVAVREPGAVIEEEPIRSRRGLVWEAIKRRPSAIFGGVLLLLVILGALLAPVLAPYDQHQQVGPVFGHPSASHPLGLDDGGIDIVTLLMWAARTSLLVGFAATFVSMVDRRHHRSRRRLLRRQDRHDPDADHRLLHRDPRRAADDRRRGDLGAEPVSHHHRDRDPALDEHGAGAPGAGEERARTRLREARPLARRIACADRVPPRAAAGRAAADRERRSSRSRSRSSTRPRSRSSGSATRAGSRSGR